MNADNQEFGKKLTEETREKLIAAGRQDLVDTNDLLCSGYAGVNKKGTIVDRRVDPDAVPMPYSSEFPDTPPPKKIERVAIVGASDHGIGRAVAQRLAAEKVEYLPIKDTFASEKVSELTKEVVGQQNPELKAAFDALSEYDKEMLKRGYKMWKTNGKSEYVLVDADPTDFNFGPKGITRKKGTNFTPKKKKRK